MDLFVQIIQVATDLRCEFHVNSMIRNAFIDTNITYSLFMYCKPVAT